MCYFCRTYVPDDRVRIDGRPGIVVDLLKHSKTTDRMRVLIKFVNGETAVCEYVFGELPTIKIANPLDLLAEV
jgi:hypothetical protein